MQVGGVSLPNTFGLWTSDGRARFFPIGNFPGTNLQPGRRISAIVTGFWVLLAVLGSSETSAQIEAQKCDRCGQLTTSFFVCCELVPEVKKEKKTVWRTRQEYFWTQEPGVSLPHLLCSLTGLNRGIVSQPAKITPTVPGLCQEDRPPACSSPRVRKILLREEKEEETVTWKCQSVILCPSCAQGTGFSPAKQGEKATPDRSV